MASSVPKKRPPSAAMAVSSTVYRKPFHRKGSAEETTPKSRCMSALLFPAGDVAGHGGAPLDHRHHPVRRHRDDDVDHGRGSEGLEEVERVLPHLARPEGQLGKPDRER